MWFQPLSSRVEDVDPALLQPIVLASPPWSPGEGERAPHEGPLPPRVPFALPLACGARSNIADGAGQNYDPCWERLMMADPVARLWPLRRAIAGRDGWQLRILLPIKSSPAHRGARRWHYITVPDACQGRCGDHVVYLIGCHKVKTSEVWFAGTDSSSARFSPLGGKSASGQAPWLSGVGICLGVMQSPRATRSTAHGRP